MPADGPTLRERYAADLTSGSLAVTLTALVLAMVAGLGSTLFVEFVVGFLLLVLLGVFLPYAHEAFWPQDRGWKRDVAWTISAAAVAASGYLVGVALIGRLLGDATHAASLAFVATLAGGSAVLIALQRRRAGRSVFETE